MLPGTGRVPGYRVPVAFSMSTMVEKVLDKAQYPAEWPYSDEDFARMDETDDAIFYDQSRLVYHIDDYAVSALTNYYEEHLKDGDDVLDICSSWVSHYPKDKKLGKVVGLGMNEYELKQNPQLSDYVVKDLNKDPTFPFDDASFDKVTCVVSIDYLNKPLQVCKEVGRVLRPGGEFIISMSNRCFPTKGIVRAAELLSRTEPNSSSFRFISPRFFSSSTFHNEQRSFPDLAANKRFGARFHSRIFPALFGDVRKADRRRH